MLADFAGPGRRELCEHRNRILRLGQAEHAHAVAQPEDVSESERCFRDAQSVDECAVRASEISHDEEGTFAPELGVPPR